MKPRIYNSRATITETALNRLETQLNYSLPAAYRTFLLRHNGGQPQPPTFVPAGQTAATETVNSFLALNGDPEIDDLMTFLNLYQDRLPAGLLPVAYDAFGNLICLGLVGEDRGRVYLWLHEDEGISCLIAPDWNSFLASFQDNIG